MLALQQFAGPVFAKLPALGTQGPALEKMTPPGQRISSPAAYLFSWPIPMEPGRYVGDYLTPFGRRMPSLPEAIRRLVELGLTVPIKSLPDEREDEHRREDPKQRARELASNAIDKVTDPRASPDDQASRKRKLIKGPEEFQKVRRAPKPKMIVDAASGTSPFRLIGSKASSMR